MKTLASCVLLLTSVAHAEDLSPSSGPSSAEASADAAPLDDLMSIIEEEKSVISATKFKMSAAEAPSVITVITETDIRDYGYQSVADALRHVTGLYVRDDLIHPNVSMRGIDAGLRGWSRDIKVLLNGQPIAYRSDTSNWLGPEMIPMDAVARIEVIRGPGSALYGPNAFLGVVNVITKEGAAAKWGSVRVTGGLMARPCPAGNERVPVGNDTVNLCAATPASPRFQGNVSGMSGNTFHFGGGRSFEYLLAASYGYADRSGLMLPASSPHFRLTGPKYFRDPSSAISSRGDVERPLSLYAKASVNDPNFGTLTVDASLSHFIRAGEFTDWSVLTRDNFVSLYNWYLHLRYGKKLGLLPLELAVNLALASGHNTPDNHLQIARDNTFWVRKRGGYVGFDAGAELRYTISEKGSLLAGVAAQFDAHQLPSIYSVSKDASATSLPVSLQGRRLFINVGVYAQALYNPIESLGLIAGLSFDRHNVYAQRCTWQSCPALNARLGAVFFPLKRENASLYFKALYGSSFKAPPAELIYGTPYVISGITGNPALDVERANTFELVAGGSVLKHFDILVNGFVSLIDGKVEYVQAGNFIRSVNSSNLLSYGIEATATAKYDPLSVYANFAWARTTLRTCLLADPDLCRALGEENALYPSILFNTGASYRLVAAHLVFSLSGNYVGSRWASQSNRLENLPSSDGFGFDRKAYAIPAYFLLNAMISSYGLHLWGERETVFSLSVRNMLNAATTEPGFSGIDIPGRGLTVLLSAKQAL